MNAIAESVTTRGGLADAFQDFIGAANRLEHSHRNLHEEVARLRAQLEEQNRALASSAAENERMRVLLRQILDALPCGVAVVDSEGREVLFVNPEARRLLALSTDIAIEWSDFPERMRSIVDGSCSGITGGIDEQEFCFRQNGGKRWLNVRCSVMRKPRNEAVGLVVSSSKILILSDTTTRKEAEHEREASRRVVALAEMATVLAHEIRNPLGSLELLTGLLAGDSGLSVDSKEYIQHLQAGVRSLSATVNNVLRFQNLDDPYLVPTALAVVLRNCLAFVSPLATQSGVRLDLHESLGDAEIAADAAGIQQVILNLTCNALRHTPAGGAITVLATVESFANGKVAVIEFTDTGCGIASDDLIRIFEPGFSTINQSPGLGLAVCQRIVEQHGGTISARSVQGEGATFRLEFPIL
jgi:two-component system sensor histidine kinase FlrB